MKKKKKELKQHTFFLTKNGIKIIARHCNGRLVAVKQYKHMSKRGCSVAHVSFLRLAYLLISIYDLSLSTSMHLHCSPFHVNSTLDDELASPIYSITPLQQSLEVRMV